MKNIIIAGVAKSGKSTLCEMICEKVKINHIPLDYFTAAMKRNFPECGIKSDVIINDTSEKLCKLINTISSIIDDSEEKFIIDSAHIMPRDIINNVNLDKWDIIFIGYPNISVDDKFSDIRKYERVGWTAKRTNDDLKDTIKQLINISKIIEKECHQYNIKFIDASNSFNEVLMGELNQLLSN